MASEPDLSATHPPRMTAATTRRIDPDGVNGNQRGGGRPGTVGLPEAVGFALGAGAMAKALVVLEANLAGNEAVRRVFRDGGVIAEIERAAVDSVRRLHLRPAVPDPRAPGRAA